MSRSARRIFLASSLAVPAVLRTGASRAASKDEIDAKVGLGLEHLLASNAAAKALAESAVAVLVFPDIVKGGLIVGGQYGEGALVKDGRPVAYYNTVAASYGPQIGVQRFGYALFFMNDKALAYLDKSEGWEVGVGPTITILDAGKAANFSTTTANDDIYAFFFDQRGLMAGIGIQGSKITRITPG
jgi:lipid-binding SYLF domain-containing protein